MVYPDFSQESKKARNVINPILQIDPLKLLQIGDFASSTESGRMKVPTSSMTLEPVLLNWKWQKKDSKEHASEF